MNAAPPRLRVDVVNGRKVFPAILCEDCGNLPTQHRCLVEVSREGFLFESILVCGVAICALCSQKYGGEGIFRCRDHPTKKLVNEGGPSHHQSTTTSEKRSKKDEAKKSSSSVTQSMSQKSKSSSSRWISKSTFTDEDEKKKVDEKKKTVRERGAEYSSTEILLLSKAWISASENALVGVSQRLSTFWESVSKAYNTLKEQHEEYMQRQSRKEHFRLRNLRRSVGNDSTSESDTDEPLFQLPSRNLNSLQQKWSKKIHPLVFKFIGVTHRYPRRSGEDKEAYYHRVHLIFLKENDGEKSFDIYRPAWEYLVDKPKFNVSCNSVTSRTREVITIDEGGETKTAAVAEPVLERRPLGRNTMKRKLEEEKLLESVAQKMASSQPERGSERIATAMEQMMNNMGTMMNAWALQQALSHCSDDVLRQYNDMFLKRQLADMTQNLPAASHGSNVTPLDLGTPLSSVMHPAYSSVTASSAGSNSRDEDSVISSSQHESFEEEVPCSLLR